MLCPNCGEERTDAKFCPECGTKLVDPVRDPEMPAASQTDETAVPDSGDPVPQPPIGRYKSTYGYMELEADRVTIHKKELFQKETIRVIPYSQIAAVSFTSTTKWGLGFLAIREQKDKRPLPTKPTETYFDDSSISFGESIDADMSKVYHFFAYCAESWKAAQAKRQEQWQDTEACPEIWTEAFEVKRAELTRKQIPHCPECLSTHVWILPSCNMQPYSTRFVCMWCGYEWHPRRKTRFLERNWE